MKIIVALAICCFSISLFAQQEPARRNRDFPIVVMLQFHSFSLPFRDLKSNFSNIGLGLGTEISYNNKQNWVQQVSMAWYRNKVMGNGLLLYTQAAWRPAIASDFFAEVKVGAGYLISCRPVESFKQLNGQWTSVGHRGKALFNLPVGISVGYNSEISATPVSPALTNQLLIVRNYNKSIPMVPETLVQAGVRIYPNY
ncbi:MAG: hypothetical protein ACOYXT_15830 [Bacteroidota bacterium]